LLNIEPG